MRRSARRLRAATRSGALLVLAVRFAPVVGAQGTRAMTPADRRSYAELTSAYVALRRSALDSAIAHFGRALALTPDRDDVRKELAYTYFRVGRNDLARMEFEIVVANDTLDEVAAMELAYLDYESLDASLRAKAHAVFNHLRTSRDSATRARAGEAFTSVDGALAARLAAIELDLARNPNDTDLLLRRAQVALERNDTPLVLATYRQVLAQPHAADEVRLALSRVLLAIGQSAEGEAILHTLLTSTDPEVGESARELLEHRGGPLTP